MLTFWNLHLLWIELSERQADAGWSSSVARWAHNPEVTGSNPVPATAGEAVTIIRGGLSFIRRRALRGRISDRGDDVL